MAVRSSATAEDLPEASFADQIVERGGHYILALKGNQETIIEITAHRIIKGRRSTERRYYLSSMKANAKEFLKWIRDHLSVESFHWTLDVAFADDDFQGHTGNLAENFSLLQRLTINLTKARNEPKEKHP